MNVRRTVFVSYRRSDSAGHAGRMADSLKHAGFDVFFDQTGPKAGEIFEDVIEEALVRSAVVLVVIGDIWTEELMRRQATAQQGEGPEYDYVVLEIKAALAKKCTIIPVLIDGAGVPRERDLPDDIKALPKRHVFDLRSAQWDDEIQRLAARLHELIPDVQDVTLVVPPVPLPEPSVVPEPEPPPPIPSPGRAPVPVPRRRVAGSVAALAIVALLIVLAVVLTRPRAMIFAPADGSNVPGEVMAKGTASNIPAGQTVWLVVYNGSQYWPQRPVTPAGGDEWTCTVGFGGGAIELNGKQFELLVVTADAAANKA
jgi:hypothetical protein